MSTSTPPPSASVPSGHEPGHETTHQPGFLGPDGVPQDSPMPYAAPASAPAAIWSPTPEPTYVPAPTGPNWGLVLFGLVLMGIAAGVIVNQVNGFRLTDVSSYGPVTLVAIGGACAVFGIIGMLARRRS